MSSEELWQEYWSVGRTVLHLTDEEFYALTPKQFHLLLDQYEYRVIQQQEFLFAQLTAVVVNYGYCRPRYPALARDFMPSMYGVKVKKLNVHSPKHQAKLAAQAESIFGGMMKVNERGTGKKL